MFRMLLWVFALTAGPLLAAYDINFFPTLAVNTVDQVRFVMPERGIALSRVRQVERSQPFELSIFIGIREKTGRPLKLTGSIAAKKPDGSAGRGVPEVVMFDLPAGVQGVFCTKVGVRGFFEADDPCGDWEWTLTLKDAADPAGTVRTAASGVKLVERISDDRPMDKAEFNRFFTGYYRDPRPERLLAALKHFITDGDAELRRKKNYNPNHILHGFAEAFKLNPQFHGELAAATAGLTERQQLFMALIFAELGKEVVMARKEVIDPQVQVMIGQFAGKNPLAFREVKSPVHLDMLWMEFFITGRFEPVRRLAAELRRRTGLTLREAKARSDAGQKLTEEEKQQVLGDAIRRAAAWSIASNLRQGHRLLGFYLETVVRRKLYADDEAAVNIAAIFKSMRKSENQPKGK